MMKTIVPSSRLLPARVLASAALLTLLGLLAVACTDETPEPAVSDDAHDGGQPAATDGGASGDTPSVVDGGAGGAGPSAPPLYVVATAISDDTGANTYVKVFSQFEPELDLSTAREFPGWSDMGIVGRYLFVSSGEAPTVSRFVLNEHDALVPDGEIGFGNYVDDANLYNQTLVSETKALLLGENEYIVWNPSKLEITGTIPFPELPPREGVEARLSLDRGGVLRGNRLYHTVSWTDTEELHMLPDSRIVVIDVQTEEVVDTLTVPCPDLNVADRDEGGNLYFSNWVYSPGATLLKEGAKACAVRIPADSEQLDDWSLAYDDANGHEGAALGYLGNGHLLFSSFLNDVSKYDPEMDWFDWLFGNTWELRVLDPETLKSVPVAGMPKNGGGYYAQRFDDETHVLLPGDSYTTTTIYGIASDGAATKELHTNGWATRLFKLR
jgi:hypothetical protein